MSLALSKVAQLRVLRAVLLLFGPMIAFAADAPAEVPQSSLRACAAIATDAERLACYDRLAGRAVNVAGSVPRLPAAAAAPPAAISAPPAGTPAISGAPTSAPASAAPATQTFGAYAAEHPKPLAVETSLKASVVALGRSRSGKMTVSLEGGAVWELEDGDPLLAVGNMVTITRAAFGSYLMLTPSQRTHRAHRLN